MPDHVVYSMGADSALAGSYTEGQIRIGTARFVAPYERFFINIFGATLFVGELYFEHSTDNVNFARDGKLSVALAAGAGAQPFNSLCGSWIRPVLKCSVFGGSTITVVYCEAKT